MNNTQPSQVSCRTNLPLGHIIHLSWDFIHCSFTFLSQFSNTYEYIWSTHMFQIHFKDGTVLRFALAHVAMDCECPVEIRTPTVSLFLMFLVLMKSIKEIRPLGNNSSYPSLFYHLRLNAEALFISLCVLSSTVFAFSYKWLSCSWWQPTHICM